MCMWAYVCVLVCVCLKGACLQCRNKRPQCTQGHFVLFSCEQLRQETCLPSLFSQHTHWWLIVYRPLHSAVQSGPSDDTFPFNHNVNMWQGARSQFDVHLSAYFSALSFSKTLLMNSELEEHNQKICFGAARSHKHPFLGRKLYTTWMSEAVQDKPFYSPINDFIYQINHDAIHTSGVFPESGAQAGKSCSSISLLFLPLWVLHPLLTSLHMLEV